MPAQPHFSGTSGSYPPYEIGAFYSSVIGIDACLKKH